MKSFSDDRCVGEFLFSQSLVRFEYESDRLLEIGAGFFERGTLSIRARELLNEGDEALRYLLENGCEVDGHAGIL